MVEDPVKSAQSVRSCYIVLYGIIWCYILLYGVDMVLYSIIYSVIIHFSHFRPFLHYPYPLIYNHDK
ncbi:hypothetical protein HanIR_Chr08g0342441 [Helianthus annuus]|nr:hypothetical protein HanIR_Chr08g0342441 [Helianthus annuus]